jgi:hypothetical protein
MNFLSDWALLNLSITIHVVEECFQVEQKVSIDIWFDVIEWSIVRVWNRAPFQKSLEATVVCCLNSHKSNFKTG